MSHATLQIRGARTHNLRGLDLDLPLRGLTALVGRSGSGKTSLAVDTVHAASRDRLSSALGATLAGAGGARVDALHGLPVTLAVTDRQAPPARARVLDLLGLTRTVVVAGLRDGVVACPDCDRPLPTRTADEIVGTLAARPAGERLTLLAPVCRARVGGVRRLAEEIGRQGFARVRLDGALHRIEDLPAVDARLPHDLDVVVDRLKAGPDSRSRLEEAVGTALAAGQGRLVVLAGDEALSFSEAPWCPDHPRALEPVQAGWLAGEAGGRCRTCEGLGEVAGETCPACAGTGLRDELRCFKVGPAGTPWPELVAAPLASLAALLPEAAPELARWLDPLARFGLDHLPGTRTASALSGGELRRLRVLAAWITAREVPGLLLVLDEPLAGLEEDLATAIAAELATHDGGVLAITHSRALADRAAHAVAFGPEAGRRGGAVVWQGPGPDLPTALLPSPPPARLPPPPPGAGPALVLAGATGTVLDGRDHRFPHGALTVVTGPSGSGKTSLLTGTLVPAVRAALGLVTPPALAHLGLAGTEPFAQLSTFDRSPLGQSARSCVATVLGTWAPLRELLAATRDARVLGLDAARFRFDQPGGRCEACQGTGLRQVEVAGRGLLAEGEVTEPCPVCQGHRFQRDTLRVRLKGRTVAELLDTDVHEASQLFAAHRKLGPPLLAARLVGLGYLPLGQPTATVSGGEAQRLRLARELARAGGIGVGEARRLDDRLVVLDAPTVGLHPDDVGAVVDVLRRLADRGATVVVGSVAPGLLAVADYAIALSPPRRGPRRSSP